MELKIILREGDTLIVKELDRFGRNKEMIQLLLSSGLRLSEMTSLEWRDINLMTRQLKVVEGKGAKDRMLYVDDITLRELQDWKESIKERFQVFTAYKMACILRRIKNINPSLL